MADNFSWDDFFDNTIQFYSDNPSEYLDPVAWPDEPGDRGDDRNYGGKIHLLKSIETYLREEAPFIFHNFQDLGDKYILTYDKVRDFGWRTKIEITEEDWKEKCPDVIVIMPDAFKNSYIEKIFIPNTVRILMDGWVWYK